MDYKTILNESHILIGGTTGSGKSTTLQGIINTAINTYTPNVVKFLFIDLKRVELVEWKNIPHCLGYANDLDGAINLFKYAINRLESRFKDMEQKGLTETEYTHIFIVVDELADLMQQAPKITKELISKIGRLGRAAHIHLLLATQSPQRSCLDASIQQNITCALALRCKTPIESRQVLGIKGAEKLPQYGLGIVWSSKGFEYMNLPYVSKEERQQSRERWKNWKN